MRIAAAVELKPEQRQALEKMGRGRSLPARVVERARIVLLAADGFENKEIARRIFDIHKALPHRSQLGQAVFQLPTS